MITYLKYLPQVLLAFKDVSQKYEAETGQGRPWYLSRTFVFSALCFLSTLITIATGVTFDKNTIAVVADAVPQIIAGAIALIGAILSFIAQWKSTRNRKQ